ncbi:MAG: hypothetical protein R3Y27_07550 [Clostridia bacterium]
MNSDALKKAVDKFNLFIDKLKQDKKALSIVFIGLLGLFLITFSGFSSDDETQDAVIEVNSSSDVYITNEELTTQLVALLEQIDGAGTVSAMITFDSSEEYVYAYDYSEDYEQDDDSSSTKYESQYIIINNDSNEDGLVIKSIYPTVRGVAIVCDGADNAVVKSRIISTVSALFDISQTKISVAQVAQ